MSALMSDVIEGSITHSASNAAVNAGGKLLKVVELQLKYGSSSELGNAKSLSLCSTEPESDQEQEKTLALDRIGQLREKFAALREEIDREEAGCIAGNGRLG